MNLAERIAAGPLPLIVGHRGAAAVAPENTLAAIALALDAGVDGIEIDVHLSADGVPVVIHDATVERTTDGIGPVAGYEVDALRSLDAGSWKGAQFAGARIPTLDEVLLMTAGRALTLVEVKADYEAHPGATAKVALSIERCSDPEEVLILAFDHRHLARARAHLPWCGRVALCDEPPADVRALLREFDATALAPRWTAVDAELCEVVHATGAAVITWTVDDADAARTLGRAGLDVLISNRPAEMIDALRR